MNQVPCASGMKLVSSGGERVESIKFVRMQEKRSRQETVSSESYVLG